jgi:DNA polymerase-3 subunit delta'
MAQILGRLRGHRSVVGRIQKAFREGKLPHGLLFEGPLGVGKFLAAHSIAQYFVCEFNQTHESACGVCPACNRAESLPSESILLIQPEKGMIKLDQTKMATEFLQLRSSRGTRVIIIDEAQKLNTQAANHLLKTLEEPPQNCFFILVAPSGESLLPTIQSRTIRIRFKPLKRSEIMIEADAELSERFAHALKHWSADPFGYLESSVRELFNDRDSSKKLFEMMTEVLHMSVFGKGQVKHLSSGQLSELAWLSNRARMELDQNFDPQLVLERFWINSWQKNGL